MVRVLCKTATLHVFEVFAGNRPRKQKKLSELLENQRELGQIDEKKHKESKKSTPRARKQCPGRVLQDLEEKNEKNRRASLEN